MADQIQTLRIEVATLTASSYGKMREYAVALNGFLPAYWHEVEANDTSEGAQCVHEEKKALYAELKKVKHSNPSTIWARVRKYGAEEVAKAEAQARLEAGEEGEGEGEGAGASPNRSLRLRFIEELTKLYKAGKREGSALEGDLKNAHTFIASALAEIGVDLSKT